MWVLSLTLTQYVSSAMRPPKVNAMSESFTKLWFQNEGACF